MKFAVLVVAAAAVGALATVAVPSAVLDSGTSQVQAFEHRMSWFKLRDLNPLRAIYDWEMKEIKTPRTPEELGLHPSSTVQYRPFQMPSNGFELYDQGKPGQPYRIHNGQRIPMN